MGTATHHLHEEAAGLADATGGAEDGDLVPAGLLHRLGGGAGNAGGAEKSGHGVSGEGLWVSARLTMAIGTLPDTDGPSAKKSSTVFGDLDDPALSPNVQNGRSD